MSGNLPTLAEMTGIQVQGLPNSLEINQKIWANRDRIRAAYIRDQRYDSIGKSLAYCPWSLCLMDETQTHTHLHRAGSACEWAGCDREEDHVHEFKPLPSVPPEDNDPTGRYERVIDIVKEIFGDQYQEEPLARNIYLKLEDERRAEEAEKEQKAARLADAVRAGDEAEQEFEQAAAERRAQRAADRNKAREVDQASERKRLERRAARAQMMLEDEIGNELERTSTYSNLGSITSQNAADVQPQVSRPHPPQNQIMDDNSIVETDATLGKRKRTHSTPSQDSSSPNPSATGSKAAKGNKLGDEEAPSSPTNAGTRSPALEVDSDLETSDLTLYTIDQLDAILEGAEIVRHDPKSLPIYTREFVELTPDIIIDQEPVSNVSESRRDSDTPPTSADEGIQTQNRSFLGSMPPQPPPLPQTELSEEETDMEEQLARRRQIQWVVKDPRYKKSQRETWAMINIYEDTEDSIGEII